MSWRTLVVVVGALALVAPARSRAQEPAVEGDDVEDARADEDPTPASDDVPHEAAASTAEGTAPAEDTSEEPAPSGGDSSHETPTATPEGTASREAGSADVDDDPDAAAFSLFETGRRAYDEGRNEEAIDRFREAYELSGRPVLLFNIANALERLGSYRTTIDMLRRYLPDAPREERATIELRITALEARVARRDERRGTVQPEEVSIWPPVVFAVGATLSAMAAGLGLGANQLKEDGEGLCVDTTSGLLCQTDALSDLDRADRLAVSADVFGVMGAATAIASMVWWIIDRRRVQRVNEDAIEQDQRRFELSWFGAPLPGGGTVGVHGRL